MGYTSDWHKQLIRELAWEGYSTREIAEKTGVSRTTAHKYARGLLRPAMSGSEKKPLSQYDVSCMYRKLRAGWPIREVCKEHHVCRRRLARYVEYSNGQWERRPHDES